MLSDQEFDQKEFLLVGPSFFLDEKRRPRLDIALSLGSHLLTSHFDFLYCWLHKEDDSESQAVQAALSSWGVNVTEGQSYSKANFRTDYKRLNRVLASPLVIGIHDKELSDTFRVPTRQRFDMIPADDVIDALCDGVRDPVPGAYRQTLNDLRSLIERR